MNQTQVTNIVWSNVCHIRAAQSGSSCKGLKGACCAGRAGPVVGWRALRVPRRHRRPARAEPDRRRLDDRAADCERRAPPGPDVPDAGRSAVGGVCAAEGGGDDTALGAGALRRAAGPPRMILVHLALDGPHPTRPHGTTPRQHLWSRPLFWPLDGGALAVELHRAAPPVHAPAPTTHH